MQCFAFARSGCNEGGWTSPANAGAQNSVWTRGEGGSRNKTSPGLQLIWTLIYHRIQASGCLWSTIGIRDPCKDRAKKIRLYMYCICIVLCQLSNYIVWHSDRGTNKTAFSHICAECCCHGAPQLEEQLHIEAENAGKDEKSVSRTLPPRWPCRSSWAQRGACQVCTTQVKPNIANEIKITDIRQDFKILKMQHIIIIIIIIHSLHLQDISKWI